MSSVCVPQPMISPSSSTRIWSASAMVDTRWATINNAAFGRVRFQRRPQPGVGAEVERRERVVEHVDLRADHEGPGDREPLSLPTRHVRAALGDLAVDPLGHRLHEPGGLGDLERLPQLLLGRVGAAEAQVRRHGAGEEERLLGHVADLAPQQVLVEFAHVDAVDEHRAARGVEQP